MRKLGWMALQAAAFAGGMWLEFDLAHFSDRPPNLAAGFAVGLIAAFAVTALSLDGRDWLRRLFRMKSPTGPVARSGDARGLPAPTPGEIGQSRDHCDRLPTARLRSDEMPKGRRRIG